MAKIINGIQQIGIGTADARKVFDWYQKYLGFDILVFEDVAPASLMTRYTEGSVQNRLALLALNMIGGGGLEIWQFKDRTPQAPEQGLQLGDLGINVMKIRSRSVSEAYKHLNGLSLKTITSIHKESHFFFSDPWSNWVQIVQEDFMFTPSRHFSGGVLGALIGVSDMEVSLNFYRNLLGYDIIESDLKGVVDDFTDLPGGKGMFRRVLLKHGKRPVGGFGELYGPSQVELVQSLDRSPIPIFKDRMWGDLGYIHLCFDVRGMDVLRDEAKNLNYPFTVDSADSFDMGDAAGRFAYIEDPDGTLIELVETHKVPIFKWLGIHIDLKKRHPEKPLPKWLVKMMRVHRVG
ncbi:VOC family protein [Pricia sp.]|uniref:VOC family protein n=1 Tax=Pricia sp. TaxID=2268138 RepID=UPI0035940187